MRSVTLPNDYEITVRALTTKEIRKLKPQGYYRHRFLPPSGEDDPDAFDTAVDVALNLVLTSADQKALENCAPSYTNKVWLEIIKETYGGGEEEEKNS